MTVESTIRKESFAGGQSSLTFTFRTLVDYPEYIKTLVTLTSTGEETVLDYGVDYSVSVNSDGVGGTVTVSPSYSTSYTYTVYRETSDLQESDYEDYNQFPANTVETDLDRRTLISQESDEALSRTAKVPISATVSDVVLPSPLDGYLLMWSGTGGTLINTTAFSLGTVALASQAKAEAGTDNADYMSPLRTAQAIAALGSPSFSSSSITGQTAATIALGDSIVFTDTDASDALRRASIQGIVDLVPTTSSIGVFMTNINFSLTTTTSTSVTLTGFGFSPTHVHFFTSVAGSADSGFSLGLDNGTFQVCSYKDALGNWQHDLNHSIRYENVGATQELKISSLDADGLTLSNTKTGSPTGTMVIRVEAFG